jgi:F1F0 ATPase subunit 2
MSETVDIMLALLAGIVLGVVFFGGLWWTVRRGLGSPRPAVWFLGSFLVRAAVAVAGFVFISHRDWRRLVACLLGFLLARVAVTLLTRRPLAGTGAMPKGGES